MSHWRHGPRSPLHTERPPRRVGVACLLVGAGILLALAFGGCTTITQTNGPERLTATSLFTNLSVASDCLESVDADTGLPTSATHHTLTTQGDAATLHEAGGILGALLQFAGKFVPGPVPAARGVRPGATPSPAGSPAVTSCAGERTALTQSDPVDHGSQPELLRAPEPRP
jgi:hypothetical protein